MTTKRMVKSWIILLLPMGMVAGASVGTLSHKLESDFARHGICKTGSVLGFLTESGNPDCNAFHNLHHALQQQLQQQQLQQQHLLNNVAIRNAATDIFARTLAMNKTALKEFAISEEATTDPDLQDGGTVEATVTVGGPTTLVSVSIEDINEKDYYGCHYQTITIQVNSTKVSLGKRSKLSCLEAKLYEVLELMEKYQCYVATEALEGNKTIEHAYKRISATKFSEEIAARNTLSFLDYRNPGAVEAYQSACESSGGAYSEISFYANCTEKSSSGATVYEDSLKVERLPRCYGTRCTQQDDQWLLEDFTLRTTEERNQQAYGNAWACTGTIISSREEITLEGDLCSMESDSIVGDQDIAGNKAQIATSLSKKNILTNSVVVMFTQTEGYKRACEKRGGVFTEHSVEIKCLLSPTDLSRAASWTNYVSTSYPVCRGRSCDVSNLPMTFQDHLLATESFRVDGKFAVDCSCAVSPFGRTMLTLIATFVLTLH